MEGFTVSLALLDYVPVAAFGVSLVLLGGRLHSPLFLFGGFLSLLAGLMKASWKLVLGLKQKDLPWLNRPFVPLQAAGWLLMLLAFCLKLKSLDLSALGAALSAFPACIFFAAWLLLLICMVRFRRTRFERNDAKSNLQAECINSACQLCLLTGILLA